MLTPHRKTVAWLAVVITIVYVQGRARHRVTTDPQILRDPAATTAPIAASTRTARELLQPSVIDGPSDRLLSLVSCGRAVAPARATNEQTRRANWCRQPHQPPASLAPYFRPPDTVAGHGPQYRSPLEFADGTPVRSAADWQRRRAEILSVWHQATGPWPALIASPKVKTLTTTQRGSLTQHQLRVEIGLGGQMVDAFLLVPDGAGPFPAVLVVYYDAQSGVGLGTAQRDFGWQLARHGFVTMSIGKPNSGVNLDNPNVIPNRALPYYGPVGKRLSIQPLSALAYAAANAHTVLAGRDDVYADRIGVIGHSFGGKWAMFASCLYDKFACAVWSDPGIVFDERDRRKQNPGGSVNFWDPWYLGAEPGMPVTAGMRYHFRKLPSEGQRRTGAYRWLVAHHHDLVELHALMAPRPFLVSGGTADLPERWNALQHTLAVNRLLGVSERVALTSRPTHAPTSESMKQIVRFFEWWLLEQP